MEGHAGNQASSKLDAHQFTTGDTKLVRGDGDLKDPDELGKQLCSGLNEQVGIESDPISFLIQVPTHSRRGVGNDGYET